MLLDLTPDQVLFRDTTAKLLDELVPCSGAPSTSRRSRRLCSRLLGSGGGVGVVVPIGR